MLMSLPVKTNWSEGGAITPTGVEGKLLSGRLAVHVRVPMETVLYQSQTAVTVLDTRLC